MLQRCGVAILAWAILGCGGASAEVSAKGANGADEGRLDVLEAPARCQTEGRRESLVDLNQDGTPDIRKVYASTGEGEETLVCREADLNFDGIKELYLEFSINGERIRDEVDLDLDGVIDIISYWAKGRVIKQELDTNSDARIDRVRYLENDVPVRLEGDTDGDGQVDYWEYYEDGKLVRIGQDHDGDGRADEWSRDSETEEAALGGGEAAEPTGAEGADVDGEAGGTDEDADGEDADGEDAEE